ncbi:hypothetical protein CDAR_168871 [Caerostris darwini]|uniref:Uncharacterized protein n=1 Tax=Caerostris darwini TaxID=1538125 RepID=A0AAV4WPX6_9ARAC|nr:hypothetical protein CDAR_168871 [Caerostris darwini]
MPASHKQILRQTRFTGWLKSFFGLDPTRILAAAENGGRCRGKKSVFYCGMSPLLETTLPPNFTSQCLVNLQSPFSPSSDNTQPDIPVSGIPSRPLAQRSDSVIRFCVDPLVHLCMVSHPGEMLSRISDHRNRKLSGSNDRTGAGLMLISGLSFEHVSNAPQRGRPLAKQAHRPPPAAKTAFNLDPLSGITGRVYARS